MAYVPDPTDVAAPSAGVVKAATAADEFRAIKLYLRDIVLVAIAGKIAGDSPTLTGTPSAPTPPGADSSTRIATTAFVKSQGYLSAAAGDLRYPLLNGSSATGTWPISITGNAGTASAVTWASVSGKPAIVAEIFNTAAEPLSLAKRNSLGYLYAEYFHQGSAVEGVTPGAVIVENTAADGFFRKLSWGAFNLALTPAWGNISGKPTLLSQFTNDLVLSNSQVVAGLGFTPYNATNPLGFITGITGGNVTAALGYTPYNAANPAGYLTSVSSGAVTGALGYTPASNTNPAVTGTLSATGLLFGRSGGGLGLGRITVTTTPGTPSGMSAGDIVLVY